MDAWSPPSSLPVGSLGMPDRAIVLNGEYGWMLENADVSLMVSVSRSQMPEPSHPVAFGEYLHLLWLGRQEWD